LSIKFPGRKPMKKNCWEFKKCGREAGGSNADSLGVCPAATEERLNGVHDGINAGRACWVLAGTQCGGTVQGTFAQKFGECQLCDFFRMVKKEEGGNYRYSISLLNRINAFRRPDKAR
jgi:hypothetical protein